MSKYYLGIMCGTSLDSIDISMIRCHGDKIKVIAFAEYRLKNKIKEQINISWKSKKIIEYFINSNYCRL